MTDKGKTIGEKYLEFLIENEYWTNSFSYAVDYAPSAYVETGETIPSTELIPGRKDTETYEIKKIKRVGDEECLCYMEMGFMCHIPIKITALESYTRMIKFKVEYFTYEHEFNVYAPTNVSPDEFSSRVYSAVKNYFSKNMRTGHPHFEDFKNHFKERKDKFWGRIGESFKAYDQKRYEEWLQLREESKNNEDEPGYGLCYCGHTKYCECGDPTFDMFKQHLKNKNIKLGDPDNGWKTLKED